MKHNKRYLLFVHADYESMGGWGDMMEAFETLDGAEKAVPKYCAWYYDNYEIVDLHTLEPVKTGRFKHKLASK